MPDVSTKYQLEERTAKFGEAVIVFCSATKLTPISRPLVDQLIRSSTSIGANYMEANDASSRKDFLNKIHICKKEAQETQHWLRMMGAAMPEKKDDLRTLWQECHELVLIFQKITTTLRQ